MIESMGSRANLTKMYSYRGTLVSAMLLLFCVLFSSISAQNAVSGPLIPNSSAIYFLSFEGEGSGEMSKSVDMVSTSQPVMTAASKLCPDLDQNSVDASDDCCCGCHHIAGLVGGFRPIINLQKQTIFAFVSQSANCRSSFPPYEPPIA